jgi:hypothetical protein
VTARNNKRMQIETKADSKSYREINEGDDGGGGVDPS